MQSDGVTLLFHRSNIPSMRWKATVIVRLFQYMSFIWSVNNNNFFSLKYVELCAWKSVFACSSSSLLQPFALQPSWFIEDKCRKYGDNGVQRVNMKKTAAESHRTLVEVYGEMLPNTRRARRIFGSHSSSHFKTIKNSRIHSKARKLGSTWTQAERCWKAVCHVRNAARTPQKEVIFASK